MSVVVYGIPNCDTVKKARAWLDARGVVYRFHDFRKAGLDPARAEAWVSKVGWERLVNRAGTTFRALSEAEKAGLDAGRAVALMLAHPTLIKRPVVEAGDALLVGFRPDDWARDLG